MTNVDAKVGLDDLWPELGVISKSQIKVLDSYIPADVKTDRKWWFAGLIDTLVRFGN